MKEGMCGCMMGFAYMYYVPYFANASFKLGNYYRSIDRQTDRHGAVHIGKLLLQSYIGNNH